MSTIYKFKAVFTKLGIGTVPSSAPVCTVVDSGNNILANAQATTALTNLPGVYLYSYTGTSGLDVIALFHTSDTTVDQRDLYSYTPDVITTNIDATISSRQSLGGGSISTTVTITDGANPLDGVDVWITTDAPGVNIVARGFTNTSGNVTFMLDAGTYYVWKQLSGYSFANPQTMTV